MTAVDEIKAEIAEIRARPDELLEMPVIAPERRAEYIAGGNRSIERLERLLEEEEAST